MIATPLDEFIRNAVLSGIGAIFSALVLIAGMAIMFISDSIVPGMIMAIGGVIAELFCLSMFLRC